MGLTRNLEIVRELMSRELETVNTCHHWIEEADNDELKRMISHIRDEKKDHVSVCYEYLKLHDDGQSESHSRVLREHFPDGVFVIPGHGHEEPVGSGKDSSKSKLTVGSLQK